LAESSLPLAVSEVLSTTKGTVFYVLTVAGEHGIPPEKESPRAATPEDGEETSAFLTQSESVNDAEKKELPRYLKTIHIDEDFIMDIKKT